MRELKVTLTEEMLKNPLEFELPTQTLYIDRSKVGNPEERSHNLIGFSRRNRYINELLIKLATKGFFLVSSSNGNSRFEKFTTAKEFKPFVKRDNIQIYNNIYYTLEEPKLKFASNRLIVVFSSVADRAFNADIATRNFFVNFETIYKYIPQNCYILRVSDIGGVIGNFYMNTTFSNTIEDDIQGLLNYILETYNINKKDVVLYGSSKGATASLYHGILGNFRAICVDPVVSDEYHELYSGDSHFTKPCGEYKIYPQTKQDKFSKFIQNREIEKDSIYIIYSKQSPIYNDINSIVKKNDIENKIIYLDVCHPKIKSHPDVAPNTINIFIAILNNIFYNLGEIKSKEIDCLQTSSLKEFKIKSYLKLTNLVIESSIDFVKLRVYNKDLQEYKDIDLNIGTNKISIFTLKGKLLSIVYMDKEYELNIEVDNKTVLSKIVNKKRVTKDNKDFNYISIS